MTEASSSLSSSLDDSSTSHLEPFINMELGGLPSNCERASHTEPSSPLPARSSLSGSLPTAPGRSMMIHFPATSPSPSHMGSSPLQRNDCIGLTISSTTSDIPAVPVHALVVDDDQLTRKLMERMLQVRLSVLVALYRPNLPHRGLDVLLKP